MTDLPQIRVVPWGAERKEMRLATYHPEERRTGLRSWSRGRWILIAIVLIAIAVIAIVALSYTGGSSGGGGGGY